MSLLELDGVRLAFGSRAAVDGVDLAVEAGERVALLGPSGCGKTSVLRLLAGLEAPDAGVVRIGGRLASAAGRIVVPPGKRGIGMVFQDLALWPHRSVAGNLELGLRARGMPRSERRRKIRETLALVELEGLERRRPWQLSGGQQQRVALARALVLEPAALLLDEPFSSLDHALARRLVEVVLALHERLGFALLHVTHDPSEARRIAGRIVRMDRGRIVTGGGDEPVPRRCQEPPRTADR